MNAFRKYAVWIVGLGLAAFIIPSVVGSIGKFSSNTKPSVKQPSQPYEPPFRVDGTVWAVNGADTTTVFETEYATTPEAIEIGMMYRRSTPSNSSAASDVYKRQEFTNTTHDGRNDKCR